MTVVSGGEPAVHSPDGARILTASADHSAKLWDAASGKLLASFAHQDEVFQAEFSPDGARILTASRDKTAKLWDAASGKLIASFDHQDGLYHAAFSPDGARILTASGDKTAKLWDAASGKLIASFDHQDTVPWAGFINALTEENVAQLREAVEAIGRGRWAVFSPRLREGDAHPGGGPDGLEGFQELRGFDQGLLLGKAQRNGRQLVRVSTPDYKEVLFEKLYAGNTTSCEVLKRTIGEVERILGLQEDRTKRRRTLIRLDGGFGTDANLNWLMWRGYEFIAKGYGESGLLGGRKRARGWLGGRPHRRSRNWVCPQRSPVTPVGVRPW